MVNVLGPASCCRTLNCQLNSKLLSRLSWTAANHPTSIPPGTRRNVSSSSEWVSRQSKDVFYRQAQVDKLKSRAAYKLLEMDVQYSLFRSNQTVVDLGYAPGSWSQVAVERTRPHGLVVGVDLIPTKPPRGVTSIQGDFLSPKVRQLVKHVLIEQQASTMRRHHTAWGSIQDRPSYIDMEKQASQDIEAATDANQNDGRMVDVVVSDMSEPWPQTSGFSTRTLSNPYRLMNTSGIKFKDHAVSMDLCYAALQFASDTLKIGGHFVCKFYQGSEDKLLQTKLEKMFQKVHRDKPDASRNESKEMYFVALKRRGDATIANI